MVQDCMWYVSPRDQGRGAKMCNPRTRTRLPGAQQLLRAVGFSLVYRGSRDLQGERHPRGP